ncbi:MAG: hypothetical protein Q8916_09410 [Bacteroidota bacterium]|nr:hypothetical protein [Bacteroidota bacterium]MDP4230605.1 hypothetical protein [Bacteroidota bacterium]MDP4235696.1 hypothetical protein [Bacteroidota bacterium]
MKNSIKYWPLALLIVFSAGRSAAQTSEHPWSLGIDGLANILQGDYNNHPLSFSGDLYLNYDMGTWFSLSAAFSLGELKMKLDPNEQERLGYPPELRTDYTSLELYGVIPIYTAVFTPEIFLGAELVHFNTKSADGAAPLPAIPAFKNDAFGILLGLAFEFRIDSRFSATAKTILHLAMTDHLDYYPIGSNDAFTTFGAGISYRFGKDSASQ